MYAHVDTCASLPLLFTLLHTHTHTQNGGCPSFRTSMVLVDALNTACKRVAAAVPMPAESAARSVMASSPMLPRVPGIHVSVRVCMSCMKVLRNVCECVFLYAFLRARVCVCVHVHVHVYVCMCVCMCECACACVHVCMCMCMCECVCACVNVCVHV